MESGLAPPRVQLCSHCVPVYIPRTRVSHRSAEAVPCPSAHLSCLLFSLGLSERLSVLRLSALFRWSRSSTRSLCSCLPAREIRVSVLAVRMPVRLQSAAPHTCGCLSSCLSDGAKFVVCALVMSSPPVCSVHLSSSRQTPALF